jgi:hypothetical protein
MKPESPKSALRYTSLIVLFVAIFSELVGLLILHQTKSSHNFLVLFDSFLLVILLLPVLYFFVYRPLSSYVNNINLLNAEKDTVIKKLNTALEEIKTLKGILPICASCKKIRDDTGYWNQIESYIKEHSEAEFSHGLCPDCAEKLYPEFYPRRNKE